MIPKVRGLLCLVLLTCMAAMGSEIPIVGPGSSGTVDAGQPFSYDIDHDWDIPGVGGTLTGGFAVDQVTLGASPYAEPWSVTTLTTDSITFTASPRGDLLINGNSFVTGGAPDIASLSADGLTPVPEPGSFVLFASGMLGLAAVFRRKILP